MKAFAEYTYDDALKLFGKDRRPKLAQTATKFLNGDHWQEGEGFLGEMPPPQHPSHTATKEMLRKGFVSVNVVKEVVNNHNAGVLSREPIWSFLASDGTNRAKAAEDTYAPLTDYWNERERLADLKKVLKIVLCEEVAVRRIFFPRGLVGGEIGTQQTKVDLATALDFIYCETLTADIAGVFTDPDTQKQIGMYFFEIGEESAREKWVELTYLNDSRETVVKRVSKAGESKELTYNLGGRLLIYEVRREALITEQVQSNQKALNLSHTMMMRNVNLAGARERNVSNAQPPKSKKKVADPNSPTGVKIVEEAGVYVTGGGAVNYLMGWPLYNDKGQVVGYTNPNVTITDPASVETFKETSREQRAAILSQCQQTYKMKTDDAQLSGKSQVEARSEFEGSLKDSKVPLDGVGRWELETTIRLAAQLTQETEKYLNLRADFNCLIDAGPPDPDTRRVVMEMRKPGGATNKPLISDETARGWCGIDDAEAELVKIDEEAKGIKPPTKPVPPPPVEDRTGEDLLA